MKADIIIVGQGIAGTLLAWFLLKKGCRIIVIDEFNAASASQIASGIINPVTGKRFVKSWRIDELLPFAAKTYHEIEETLDVRFLSEKAICKIFSNREDFSFFRQKNETGELSAYVHPLTEIPEVFKKSDWNGAEISPAYQLNYPLLLRSFRNYLQKNNLLLCEKFSHEKLQVAENEIVYAEIRASKIIFCEGSNVAINPHFRTLPFKFVKGEIITVRMENFPADKIWHKGIFITPLGNECFSIGATYSWDFKDSHPTEEGKNDLLSRLGKAVSSPFEFIRHDAAVRPAVADRRPLLGFHPRMKNVGIFNGMGTKGASLAPSFANQMALAVLENDKIDSEVNVNRFGSLLQ